MADSKEQLRADLQARGLSEKQITNILDQAMYLAGADVASLMRPHAIRLADEAQGIVPEPPPQQTGPYASVDDGTYPGVLFDERGRPLLTIRDPKNARRTHPQNLKGIQDDDDPWAAARW